MSDLPCAWKPCCRGRGPRHSGGSLDLSTTQAERVNDFETKVGLISGAGQPVAESRQDHGNRWRDSHSPLENPAGFPHLSAAGVIIMQLVPFLVLSAD